MGKEGRAVKSKAPAEPSGRGGPIKITMKFSGSFTGAANKKKYAYSAYDILEVSPEDIVHLDKADYILGVAQKPAQESKKK